MSVKKIRNFKDVSSPTYPCEHIDKISENKYKTAMRIILKINNSNWNKNRIYNPTLSVGILYLKC